MEFIGKLKSYRDFAAASGAVLAGELGGWAALLAGEFELEYFKRLRSFLGGEMHCDDNPSAEIFPPADEVFSAFKLTPPSSVKAVIIGQDPYHAAGQAHGLAFSVKHGVAAPKSLQNIYKELSADFCAQKNNNAACDYCATDSALRDGCLENWARQGVLLLNTVLTVRSGAAGSHRGAGWEIFTDKVLEVIDDFDRPIAFVLWGNDAKKKKAFINNKKRLIIESAHPSPLSAHRGFFGSKPFSRINIFLTEHGENPIEW